MTTEMLTERQTLKEVGRILVADPDETFSGAVAQLLEWRGYDCDIARDIANAEHHLGTADYDLVIMDIGMPDAADLALARRMAAARVPVILVTDRPSLESALSAIDLSVSGYLVKPIDFPQFLVRVRAAMESAGLRQSLRAARDRMRATEELLARSLQTASPHGGDNDLQTFLMAALSTLVDGVSDVRKLAERMSKTARSSEPCRLLHCPRLQTALSAIAETVIVLENTKTAFKSRQLGDLRERLQSLLDDMRPTLATGLRARLG